MTDPGTTLAYYTEPGPMTTLPAGRDLVGELPTDVERLRQLVSGLVVHGDLVGLYGLAERDGDLAEMELRPVEVLLSTLWAKQDAPLTVPRSPVHRLVGSCRDFAVLYCALLREQGVPSRVRCGFASYFEPGNWGDHWLLEYWNGSRWQRGDAEVDPVVARACHITLDPGDVPASGFLAGAEVWQRCRRGELEPRLFGYLDSRGERMIAGSVIRDLAALNKVEMLPWDYWGLMDDWDLGRSMVDPGLIDELADAVCSGDLSATRACYRHPGVMVPADPAQVRPDR